MRRGASRERLFFLLVLVGALLLLSGLMLRHESAVLSTRTFRDGFTVAESAARRSEIADNNNAMNKNTTKVLHNENYEKSEAEGVRTTTIKTEDGDEITIKRAVTSKGSKVTTISRDEKGKLTIEDTTAKEELRKETGIEANTARERQNGSTDSILFASPSTIRQEKTYTTIREREASVDTDDKQKDTEVVSDGKKVTLVQVNRSLTKVSLSDVVEYVDKEATR